MTQHGLTAVKTLQNPSDFAVREARKAWGRSISRTDAHARKCRACNARRHPEELARLTGTLASIDPFKPCRKALLLWDEEVATRKAFQSLGGSLGF